VRPPHLAARDGLDGVEEIPPLAVTNRSRSGSRQWARRDSPAELRGAFGTFLLRQFFLTIPREYDDAARIDGAGYLVILVRIYAPLAKPALATLAVFTFMASWNDFLGPIIYLTSEKLMTLQVGLQYFRGQYQIQTNLLMAGAVITVAPIVGIYLVAQKYFVQGVTMSGLKG
jgi:multiple sugar transport system permease protein